MHHVHLLMEMIVCLDKIQMLVENTSIITLDGIEAATPKFNLHACLCGFKRILVNFISGRLVSDNIK